MSLSERVVAAAPERVFAVLSDGWTYGGWVVGSSRIRSVDAEWPSQGSEIHHSVGVWPLLIDDTTSVEDCDSPRRLQLRVRAWPGGEGRAVITTEPDLTGCVVRIEECAVKGPAVMIPKVLAEKLLHWRNNETLRRLAFLAERA